MIDKLLSMGIDANTPKGLAKRLSFVNKAIIVLALPGPAYALAFWATGYKGLSLITLLFLCCYLLTWLLLYKQFYNLARQGLMLAAIVAIFVFSNILTKLSGIHFYFYTIPPLSLAFFESHQRRDITLSLVMCFAAMIICEFVEISVIPTIILPENVLQLMRGFSMMGAFLIVYFSLVFYINVNDEFEQGLKQSLAEAKERNLMLEKVSQQAAFTRLAMGIAHEIRNPLGGMLSMAEAAEERRDEADIIDAFIAAIKKNIFRILNITETMLKYGRPSTDELSNVDMKNIVEEALYLVEGKCQRTFIRLEKALPDTPITLKGDANRLHQVALNLLINAAESMEKGGKLYVALNCIEKQDKDMVELKIRDSGCGMSQSTIEKIFDPFYTKKYGNTGLGLSIVLKIIDQHQGHIQFDSKENEGTEVTVTLPVITS